MPYIGSTVQNPARNAHPLVHRLFALMAAEGISIAELDRRSGVSRFVIYSWFRHRRIIKLELFEAALGVLGYELKITAKAQK